MKIEVRPVHTVAEAEVFCDFDGTITLVDATDAVLESFALPTWREWEDRWLRGQITSQECLSRQVELIRADRDTVIRFAGDLPIDEGFTSLARWCGKANIPLTILSDGLDLVIEAVLRRHGLLHIPVFSNHLRWNENGIPTLSFPFATPECRTGSGTCKCALASSGNRGSCRAVYIGDGRSDYCVAARSRVVFAKGSLKNWCETQGITCFPFDTLTDVTGQLCSKRILIL
ncbi:MAG TPA: MtnX-like HAD-IB family phosphatase [Nitrospira sp.]|nr:MtnX-like HAD-IB family phosphatase [Nitrospira sp.]